MTIEYGSLMAQVLPVIALALIIDTRLRTRRSLGDQRLSAGPRQPVVVIYLLIRHGLILVTLLFAEAISLLAAQGIRMGNGAAVFCTLSALGGFVSLIWDPIHEIASQDDRAFADRLRARERSARIQLGIVTAVLSVLAIGLTFALIML